MTLKRHFSAGFQYNSGPRPGGWGPRGSFGTGEEWINYLYYFILFTIVVCGVFYFWKNDRKLCPPIPSVPPDSAWHTPVCHGRQIKLAS